MAIDSPIKVESLRLMESAPCADLYMVCDYRSLFKHHLNAA